MSQEENIVNKQVTNRLEATDQAMETDTQIPEAQKLESVNENVASTEPVTEPVKEDVVPTEPSDEKKPLFSDEEKQYLNSILQGSVDPETQEMGSKALTDIAKIYYDGGSFKTYDEYTGNSWTNFTNSIYNAGVIRTGQGLANLIPVVASAVSDADWASDWIDSVNEWADANEELITAAGQKSFFETGDLEAFASGLGQGIGSIIPMLVATG
ncbi:MAG: hypothetical protein ACW98D_17970, partial [Promethearchaeota archaeon]